MSFTRLLLPSDPPITLFECIGNSSIRKSQIFGFLVVLSRVEPSRGPMHSAIWGLNQKPASLFASKKVSLVRLFALEPAWLWVWRLVARRFEDQIRLLRYLEIDGLFSVNKQFLPMLILLSLYRSLEKIFCVSWIVVRLDVAGHSTLPCRRLLLTGRDHPYNLALLFLFGRILLSRGVLLRVPENLVRRDA